MKDQLNRKALNIIKLCSNDFLKSVVNSDSAGGFWSGDTWEVITLQDGTLVDINIHNQTENGSCHLCAYPVIKQNGSEFYSTDTLNAYFEQYDIKSF